MSTFQRHRAARGFTLIELLIVVIIIAILAAIAIPQFANSSGDAQESAMDANLATMRSAIELYRVQHNNSYPTAKASASDALCTGTGATVGTGAINTAQAFKEQMTTYSNKDGATCSIAATGYSYGPYMRAIPAEPVKNDNTVTVTVDTVPVAVADGKGWIFSNTTGALLANNVALDRSGKKKLSEH